MSIGLLRGIAAGAAGTTVLNAVTYLDMAVRGRPASDAPEQTVAKLADQVGVDIPGSGKEKSNRLSGLGPLSGTAVGLAVGAAAGVVHESLHKGGRHVPAIVSVVLIGAAAMVLSDLPLKLLGISDPTTWSRKDWAADALPHLAFGLATYATIHGADR